jgi:drug/metabolite transporter (DMT)-like permease
VPRSGDERVPRSGDERVPRSGDERVPPPRRELSPWLILVVPPLCWAGNFVIGRAISADIPPATLTFWRWAVAALVLLPFATADTWARRDLLLRHWRMLALLTATGVIGFQFFVYQGLQTTTAINGVLIIATIPVVIPIVAYLFDGIRLGGRQALGIAVSLIGVAVVILKGDITLAEGLQLAPGDLWIWLAVPSWAIYSVVVRRKPPQMPPLTLLFTTVVAGLAALAPGYAVEYAMRGGFVPTWSALAAIVYVGVFASVLAFACWNYGVASVGAARAGLFIHLMPVFAALMAILFLGEALHAYHAVGIAAIGSGLWLSSTAGRPRQS